MTSESGHHNDGSLQISQKIIQIVLVDIHIGKIRRRIDPIAQ